MSVAKPIITQSITLLQNELAKKKQRKIAILVTSSDKHCRRRRKKQHRKHNTISAVDAPTTTTKKTVINISSVALSEGEKTLLSRGLSFCPTPPSVNTFQLQYDLRVFYRRLRLREYFLDEERNVNRERNPFRLKNSTWMPPRNREPALETYIQVLDENLNNMPVQRVRDNLTKSERTALRTLQRRIAQNEVVIKPADKGSATVVMSFDDYVKEAEH